MNPSEIDVAFVQCNYWFARILCRVLFQCVRQGVQTVTTRASPKHAEWEAVRRDTHRLPTGDCDCEYQGTGMGVSVSTRVQGWVPLYQGTGMGATVSG